MASDLSARPSLNDLTFQVYDRSIHPDLVPSIHSRNFDNDGYRLTLHLTQAGHFLEWRRGTVTLVELLADNRTTLPESHQLFSHRIGPERAEQYSGADATTYQTCFQLERMTPDIFCDFHDEIIELSRKQGVLHELKPSDRFGLSPLSYVDLQSRPGSLNIHAFHTYPADFAVIKVQSLIEIH